MALPPLQDGTESSKGPWAAAYQPGGSRCTGMASCRHCSCKRARASSDRQADRPIGGLPSLRTLKVPLQGTLPSASIISHGPESVTDKVLVAPGMQDGVGSRLEQEAPSSQREELSPTPPCSAPTHLHNGASLAAGAGQFFGHREIQTLWAHLRIHLHARPAHTLPTADSIANLTLSGWGSRGEYEMAWEAAVSLLTCFFKELTSLV